MKKFFYISAIASLFLSALSCDNTSSNDLEVSRVNFVNAINAVPTNLLVNEIKVNATPQAFNSQRGYTNLPSGNTAMKFQSTGTTVTDYISSSYNFAPFKIYSVFGTGSIAAPASAPEAVVVEDDLTAPQSGNFRVRVAQMISNAPALDVEFAPVYTAYLKSTNAPVSPAETYTDPASYKSLFTGLTYKKVSDFSEQSYTVTTLPTHSDPAKVYKATGIFSFKVKNGTSTVATFASGTAITPGRNLTLLLSGLSASAKGSFLGN